MLQWHLSLQWHKLTRWRTSIKNGIALLLVYPCSTGKRAKIELSGALLHISRESLKWIMIRSGPTNGQNKRMAKSEVNGQNLKFFKTANGHGHSPNRQNSNRRMASQNFIFSSPQHLLRTDPDPIWTRPNNPNLKVTLSFY